MNTAESNFEKQITQGDARQHIEVVRGEVMQMGANDSENEVFNTIVEQMEDGVITPQEAMEQANNLRDSKQAYH